MKFNVYKSTGSPHDEDSEFVKSFDDEDMAWDYADNENARDWNGYYWVEER